MSLPQISVDIMFDNAGVGTASKTNSFNGGTNGVTISTGNSGGASGSNFNNVVGSPRFSNAQAFGGSGLSAFNPSSGVDCHMDWAGVDQPGDVICARMYLYLVSAPSGTQRTFVLLGPGGPVSAVWIFNNRTIRVYTGFSTSIAATLTTPVPTGQWVRLELRYTIDSTGTGTAEIWLYTDPDSSDPADYAISTALSWPGGKPETCEWHLQRDAGGYWHMDNIAIGPAKIGPMPGTWTNVTLSGRRGITTRRGSSRITSPVIRYEAGQATVTLDNTDRRFDPTNLSGPHADGTRTKVSPMRQIRIRATYNSITYNLFRGFVDQWDLEHVADVYSEATVTATDAFKVLNNRRRTAVDPPVGAGEDSGDRVDRILDSVGWPNADRQVSVGNSTMQATTLEGDPLAELQAVAESELGELYVDGAGEVVFRNRHAVLTETRSNTPQATFGTAGTRTPARAKLVTDDATFYNEIKVTREGGAEQVLGDTASQDEFLIKTYQASGLLLEDDAIVAGYAGWILYVSKEPEVRFDSIEIHAHADPDNLFPQVLGREIGDRIRIIRQPSGGGDAIERDVFIRGISHVTGPGTWVTTWTLQSATKYGSFLVLNNSILGRLDNNALAY